MIGVLIRSYAGVQSHNHEHAGAFVNGPSRPSLFFLLDPPFTMIRGRGWFPATLLLLHALSGSLGYHWPSPQYDALEAFLYEGERADGSNMASIVHPCKTRSATQASVAAEWLRFVSSLCLL